MFPTYNILKPQFDDIVEKLQVSGITVNVIHENNAVRKAIGEQVRQLATFATLGAQYDLAKSLIDVAEAHCVCADPNFDINKAIDIGDFGLGSDSPILLDYRKSKKEPSIIFLKFVKLSS